MTPRSLPSLSAASRALLAAEREIWPRPEPERRRAALRARTALWHARQSAELPALRSALLAWWRRGRLALLACLGATSAFAAWVALEPAAPEPGGAPESGARVAASAARSPVVPRVAPRAVPSDGAERWAPGALVQSTQRVQTPSAAQAESKPAGVAASGTPPRSRPSGPRQQGTSLEELALLDRARRAVAAGDFRAALQVIEKHARSFPESQLGEERQALRVRALAGVGLSKKAGQAAREFEASYPKSVLVPELQKDDRTAP